MKKRRIRWGVLLMAVILVFSCIFGSWQIIRLSFSKILKPAVELYGISSHIRFNEDERSKLRGYVDTTGYDIEIRELYAERENNYYNNPDPVIRWLSTTNDFAQIGAVLGSIVAICLVIFSWVKFVLVLFEPDAKAKGKTNSVKRG